MFFILLLIVYIDDFSLHAPTKLHPILYFWHSAYCFVYDKCSV